MNRPVAMITGASSGIGAAIATRLAKEGYDLALCARRQERLQSLQHSLAVEVLARTVDLRQEPQILEFFSAIKDRWGRLDVLINNAGLGHNEPLTTGTTAAWRETLEVNVLALSICTREAIQLMQAQGDRGHIVHISSMSAHRVPGSGMYSASKFAVRALTEGLRQELRAARSAIRISASVPALWKRNLPKSIVAVPIAPEKFIASFQCSNLSILPMPWRISWRSPTMCRCMIFC
jgi:NADP-dependent 3-hydroxy acid dehydrogenase YdfG